MRLAIKDALILSYVRGSLVVRRASMFIEGGAIVRVGELSGDFRSSLADEVIDASDMIAIPGLVNLHAHSGPSAVRGFAEDLRLSEWLERYVDPAHRLLTPQVAEADYLLSYSEMLSAGITHVLDLYRYPEVGASVAERVGIRATIAPYASDVYGYFESPRREAQLIKNVRGRLARVWAGFEHLSYCTPECLEAVRDVSEGLGVGVHTHEFETLEFVQRAVEVHGDRPLNVLRRHGLLNHRLVIAHAVWPTQPEVEELARAKTSVAHNPTSNMKLASGVAPITLMLRAGVNVGLGTDGSKENNRFDMFQEMKAAVLLQRAASLRADAVRATDAFRMATVNGSRALKLGTGTIEEGAPADVVLLDSRAPNMMPVSDGNALAQVVFSAHPGNVRHVIVDGELVVRNGLLTRVKGEEVEMAAKRIEEFSEKLGLVV